MAGVAKADKPPYGGQGFATKSLKILAPRAGFEPATNRLTAGCSTAELPRNIFADAVSNPSVRLWKAPFAAAKNKATRGPKKNEAGC